MNTTGQVMPNGDTVYYEDSKARDMFADAYDSTKSYAVGKHCIKDDVLYICNTAIPSGGETWNSAHWTATTFDAEVIQIKSNLDDKLGWHRPDSTVDTLAKFCSYIDDLLGSSSGYRTGYIGSTIAQRIGLSNEGYYYEAKANSENYRIVIVNNASGSLYKTLAKAGGTWQTAWKGVTLS